MLVARNFNDSNHSINSFIFSGIYSYTDFNDHKDKLIQAGRISKFKPICNNNIQYFVTSKPTILPNTHNNSGAMHHILNYPKNHFNPKTIGTYIISKPIKSIVCKSK